LPVRINLLVEDTRTLQHPVLQRADQTSGTWIVLLAGLELLQAREHLQCHREIASHQSALQEIVCTASRLRQGRVQRLALAHQTEGIVSFRIRERLCGIAVVNRNFFLEKSLQLVRVIQGTRQAQVGALRVGQDVDRYVQQIGLTQGGLTCLGGLHGPTGQAAGVRTVPQTGRTGG